MQGYRARLGHDLDIASFDVAARQNIAALAGPSNGPLSSVAPQQSACYALKMHDTPLRRYMIVREQVTEGREAPGRPYDTIVIGAGYCGVIFLAYAREQGLDCLLLDKQDDVGGLWAWLPSWQDIQNRRQDFAVNAVPLRGVTQPAIHQHVREWVEKYELAPHIRLRHEVTSVAWMGDYWNVETTRGTFRCRHLAVASGAQNEPRVPNVRRVRSDIVELHSSQLRRPEDLRGQRVTVVGGGSSSWDLLDLALEQGADEIHWVCRRVLWFLPTGAKKQRAWPNLRQLAIMQTVLNSSDAVNGFLRWMLRRLYRWHGLEELEPDEPFDIRKHQLIPGRRVMIRNLHAISRHQGQVRSLEGNEVVLTNGDRFATDTLLWATGYRMSLEYLGLPEFAEVDTVQELRYRLGSLVRSRDYPNLFFLGMSLLDSTSATPFFAAVEAKSVVSHILGRCEVPDRVIPNVVAYWDVLRHFSKVNQPNEPRMWSNLKLFMLALWYQLLRNRSVRI
ncbi:NAD(P)-binding domain-containing protein [Ectothiorhodospiraceae bacterium WFHF3C12]|nr:NAD(P)-binding domain-containing protein [Ectothiorhodospiraceae bacterium WFHF3C12]